MKVTIYIWVDRSDEKKYAFYAEGGETKLMTSIKNDFIKKFNLKFSNVVSNVFEFNNDSDKAFFILSMGQLTGFVIYDLDVEK